MISIKKYMETKSGNVAGSGAGAVVLSAYIAVLEQMAHSSQSICPAMGSEFSAQMLDAAHRFQEMLEDTARQSQSHVICRQLEQWGIDVGRHYQEKSAEVKELLLAMLRTAEGVGSRDARTAGEIQQVTERLRAVASLEDLTQIRASIQSSAALLKSSIDRMSEEGKAAVAQLRGQVNTYQSKLEEAEKLALRDSLTGLLNRLCIEKQIEARIRAGETFSVAVIDINSFKQVNDTHGHLVGDELLKQFAGELNSASRASDLIGRWGGDEFLILFTGTRQEATAQVERLEKWVCGNYTLGAAAGELTLAIQASFGMAESLPGETMSQLLARADQAMYQNKPSKSRR